MATRMANSELGQQDKDFLICDGCICYSRQCALVFLKDPSAPFAWKSIPILGRGEITFLWIEQKYCLAWNDHPMPVGVIKGDDYICKFGLGVCTSGLKKNYDMKNLFSAAGQFLVCKDTLQLPFGPGTRRTPALPLTFPSVTDPLSHSSF